VNWNTNKSKFIYFLIFLPIAVLVGYLISQHQQFDREEDFEWEIWVRNSVEITGYTGANTSIRIPRKIQGMPILSIYHNAFYEMGLTRVIFPRRSNLGGIGNRAFMRNQIKHVTIPSRTTIPRGIISIGDWAFAENGLTSLTLQRGLGIISDWAFALNQLSDLRIPDSVHYIGTAAFAINQLNSVNIPNSVTFIGDRAFAQNRLTQVTIPNRLTTIKGQTFAWNYLTEISIPDSVTFIGKEAFAGNQLTKITIGSYVTMEEDGGFGPAFYEFYKSNGYRAGIYLYNGDDWGF